MEFDSMAATILLFTFFIIGSLIMGYYYDIRTHRPEWHKNRGTFSSHVKNPIRKMAYETVSGNFSLLHPPLSKYCHLF